MQLAVMLRAQRTGPGDVEAAQRSAPAPCGGFKLPNLNWQSPYTYALTKGSLLVAGTLAGNT